MPTAEVRRYWQRLVDMGCVICRRPAEIAHMHGPSLTERGFLKPKGKKQSWQDWLVLPLCPDHHRLDGGFDVATASWEQKNGRAADWIDYLCELMEVDLWTRAKEAAA